MSNTYEEAPEFSLSEWLHDDQNNFSSGAEDDFETLLGQPSYSNYDAGTLPASSSPTMSSSVDSNIASASFQVPEVSPDDSSGGASLDSFDDILGSTSGEVDSNFANTSLNAAGYQHREPTLASNVSSIGGATLAQPPTPEVPDGLCQKYARQYLMDRGLNTAKVLAPHIARLCLKYYLLEENNAKKNSGLELPDELCQLMAHQYFQERSLGMGKVLPPRLARETALEYLELGDHNREKVADFGPSSFLTTEQPAMSDPTQYSSLGSDFSNLAPSTTPLYFGDYLDNTNAGPMAEHANAGEVMGAAHSNLDWTTGLDFFPDPVSNQSVHTSYLLTDLSNFWGYKINNFGLSENTSSDVVGSKLPVQPDVYTGQPLQHMAYTPEDGNLARTFADAGTCQLSDLLGNEVSANIPSAAVEHPSSIPNPTSLAVESSNNVTMGVAQPESDFNQLDLATHCPPTKASQPPMSSAHDSMDVSDCVFEAAKPSHATIPSTLASGRSTPVVSGNPRKRKPDAAHTDSIRVRPKAQGGNGACLHCKNKNKSVSDKPMSSYQ